MLQHPFRQRLLLASKNSDVLVHSMRSNADLPIYNAQPIRHCRPSEFVRVVEKSISVRKVIHRGI
jgi:hypothetical protein